MYSSVAMSDSTECPVNNYTLTTKSKVLKIEYRWEIPDFAEKVRAGWQKITKPVIHAIGTKVYWQLEMEPDCDGFLCIVVRQCENRPYCRSWDVIDSKMQISCDACIIDVNNREVCHVAIAAVPCSFVTTGKGCPWKVIRRTIVLGKPSLYLPDGNLTVLCTIYYIQPETYTYPADRLKAPVPVVPPPVMDSGMENALTEGSFSDVTVVADECEFAAHRVILAERSEVFRAMFECDMAEKRDNRVVIEDLSMDAISDLLTFIYTDSAPNINELAPDLLAAAEKYNIPRLKALCEVELAKSLDIDNVIDRLIASDTYRASQLKDVALYWIGKHAPDVVKTTSWKSLTEHHPELVTAVCEQFASYIEMFITDGPKFGKRKSSAEEFGRMFGSVRLGNVTL